MDHLLCKINHPNAYVLIAHQEHANIGFPNVRTCYGCRDSKAPLEISYKIKKIIWSGLAKDELDHDSNSSQIECR